MRLSDGETDNEGRLEVFHENVWGSVCDDLFDDNAISVACNQMGYESGTAMPEKGPHTDGKVSHVKN